MEKCIKLVETEGVLKYRKFAKAIPNTAVVCRNNFTGCYYLLNEDKKVSPFFEEKLSMYFDPKVVNKLLPPWIETKRISLCPQTVEVGSENYKTKDGFMISVNSELTFKMVDPIRFEYNKTDVILSMMDVYKSLLKKYYNNKTLEEAYSEMPDKNALDVDKYLERFNSIHATNIEDLKVKNISDAYKIGVPKFEDTKELLKKVENQLKDIKSMLENLKLSIALYDDDQSKIHSDAQSVKMRIKK